LLIIFTLMTEAIPSSETSLLTAAMRRHIPRDVILQKAGCLRNITGSSAVVYKPALW
jgi:hypothetical protein